MSRCPTSEPKIRAIDLFCGAGGLTRGLKDAGIDVVAGIDVDAACRFPFEKNNDARFVLQDVATTKPSDIGTLFDGSDIRILAGGAPCQPFSTYAQRYDVHASPRWALLYQFGRLIRGTLPDIVTMENVPPVEKHMVYDDFMATLRELGYRVWHEIIDCSDYGLPQRRRRVVLLASRLGEIELIEPERRSPKTVRESIGDLPPLDQGESSPNDPLHAASRLSPLNLERIRASRPGGTWRDWPKHLVADCHRRDTGQTYSSVYGRMTWDDPAPTLTTQYYGFGNGRFGHPEQDRAISLREGAMLQGFPESYVFVRNGDPVRFKVLGRLIGNAVPVTLGRVIGKSILRHLSASSLK